MVRDPYQKKRHFSRRTLDSSLVACYYHHFGHVQRVLDLGCGLGCMGRLKPDPEIQVYGLDISSEAVAKAKEYENAQVWDLETYSLPFSDEYFDAVLAKDILEHLERPWLVVKEIYRVLRPSRIVIASVPMPKPKVVWDDYAHIRGFTRNALKLIFEDSGFEVLHIKNMGGVPLAGKLRLVKWIPYVLKIPLLDLFWGRSFEIKARKL